MLQFLTRILGFRSKTTSTKRAQRVVARRPFQPKVEALETREVPTAQLVPGGDINVGPNSSSPQELVDVNGTLFFTANDGIFGRELWHRTVQPSGNVVLKMVKDIFAGGAGSEPLHLTKVGKNTLYFSANDGLRGRELWRTVVGPNGPLVTDIVKDINPGGVGSDPTELTEFRNKLFFVANDGLRGRELWQSNGTLQNTTIVKDINPGAADSTPDYLTVVKVRSRPRSKTLFFQANDGLRGAELWRSDGFGAILVKDIRPGPLGSNPFNLTKVSRFDPLKPDELFFGANDGINGAELWHSNGTDPSTTLVRDINPGPADSLEESPTTLMAEFRYQLFFAANDGFTGRELWRSTPRTGSFPFVSMVRDINPGPGSSNPTAQEHPLPERRNLILERTNGIDRLLFFGANDGFTGGEPWRTDGKPGGTLRLLDINPGPASSLIGNELVGIAVRLFNLNKSRVYFAADDGIFGRELWNATANVDRQGGIITVITRQDTDINPGSLPSSPAAFEIVKKGNRRLVFFAADKALIGRELWQVV